MIIFDGKTLALQLEAESKSLLQSDTIGRVAIGVIHYQQDKVGETYTALKREAARRLGIGHHVTTLSFDTPLAQVRQEIKHFNADPRITGVMIQKPARVTWEKHIALQDDQRLSQDGDAFNTWWGAQVALIDPQKDVDGLHPATLQALERGSWQAEGRVLPATARAILAILEVAEREVISLSLEQSQIAVIGRSAIVGRPVYYALRSQGRDVDVMGKHELQQLTAAGQGLKSYQVVIAATGVHNVLDPDLLRPAAVVIDAGEPKSDLHTQKLTQSQLAFMTPVPGGVGPVTVACLMANAIDIKRFAATSKKT